MAGKPRSRRYKETQELEPPRPGIRAQWAGVDPEQQQAAHQTGFRCWGMLTAAEAGAMLYAYTPLRAMSEEQLSALLAKLKEDAGLQAKLKGTTDLDAFLAIAKEAGFDISKADWLKYQAQQTLELSDEELGAVVGGLTQAEYKRQLEAFNKKVEAFKGEAGRFLG